jgi:hypothetical protein
MKNTRRWLACSFAVVAAACLDPVGVSTGLRGVVVRGPVMPVCMEGVPCDQPFAATFTVRQNGALVSMFESNAKGEFEVHLQPGTYVIVPRPDAPIMMPESQTRTVEIARHGLTVVQLDFDTGIR